MTNPGSARWPAYNVGPEAHVHAIGVVAISYNRLELLLSRFLFRYLGATREAHALVLDGLSLPRQLDLFKLCLRQAEFEGKFINHLRHFTTCVERCAKNRNTLMHADLDEAETTEEIIAMSKKKSRDKPHLLTPLRFKLQDIRSAAEEIIDVTQYGSSLFLFAVARAHFGKPDIPVEATLQTSLPDRPELPVLLSPPPHANKQKPRNRRASQRR